MVALAVAAACSVILTPALPHLHRNGTPAAAANAATALQQAHERPPQRQIETAPAEWVAAQSAVLEEPVIHSVAPFQPHQHIRTLPPYTCNCPEAAEEDPFAGLLAASRDDVNPLATPSRIALAGGGKARIMTFLADVYVVNLEARTDRAFYMCSILTALDIPAILWPAFPRRHVIVRTFAAQVKAAQPNPLIDYYFQHPPPPAPPHSPQRIKGPFMRTPPAACYLTHREIWIDIIQRQVTEPVLVLEDDIDVEESFVEALENAVRLLPSDWAVFWVGSCFEEMREHGPPIGHRCVPLLPFVCCAVRLSLRGRCSSSICVATTAQRAL